MLGRQSAGDHRALKFKYSISILYPKFLSLQGRTGTLKMRKHRMRLYRIDQIVRIEEYRIIETTHSLIMSVNVDKYNFIKNGVILFQIWKLEL